MIKLTSKGPVFFSHERVGRGGKPFQCWKFRTMYPDAQNRLKDILENNPTLQKEWLENQKLKHDPRITTIGKLLRKSSLDELPQFWNVLKGDLSVVGPRPILAEEVARHYGIKAEKILAIRPGLTGLWQVSGRNNISYSSRVHLDEKYVDTRTLLLDIKLIAKTLPCMIQSKGAY
jgi:undecaprenyl-phosphate galactose phosphotransferase